MCHAFMLTSSNVICGPASRGNATGRLSLVVAVWLLPTAWPRPDLGRADHAKVLRVSWCRRHGGRNRVEPRPHSSRALGRESACLGVSLCAAEMRLRAGVDRPVRARRGSVDGSLTMITCKLRLEGCSGLLHLRRPRVLASPRDSPSSRPALGSSGAVGWARRRQRCCRCAWRLRCCWGDGLPVMSLGATDHEVEQTEFWRNELWRLITSLVALVLGFSHASVPRGWQ